MNRFFLTTDQFLGDKVSFPGDVAHQIVHVLRLKEGDIVEVLDNRGFVYRVSLDADVDTNLLNGKVIDIKPVDTEPKTKLALCFGLSNRDKVEWILQKATEIGVSNFCPFVSSRTLVKSTELSSKKADRWRRIIREAAEQSQRGRLPVLEQPVDFDVCLSQVKKGYGLSLIAWEGAEPDEETIANLLNEHRGETVAIFVGPEGGFSEEEIRKAGAVGCHVISLGTRILRMETAAIVLPALVLHELGDL